MRISPAAVEKKIAELKAQAVKLAKDRANLLAMVQAAGEKAKKNGPSLAKARNELALLFELLKEYGKRRYRESDWKSIVLAVAAIIYFLNPFDMIPDFLVGGLIDDGVVISWVVAMIGDEIKRFAEWKATQKKRPKKKR
ncbi:MAG: DUF1232 domain-containing protein [Bdellovibrionaceae bacterium]|nr:DUF1232 domain-containing protein [Bdellovibrionales bacterium]MCB9254331.1 DUF1232 domain-containing protein [Pseudobdellovibrionaceae bacterium]